MMSLWANGWIADKLCHTASSNIIPTENFSSEKDLCIMPSPPGADGNSYQYYYITLAILMVVIHHD